MGQPWTLKIPAAGLSGSLGLRISFVGLLAQLETKVKRKISIQNKFR